MPRLADVAIVRGVEDGLDFDAHYKVSGHRGVAWSLVGWALTWKPESWLETDEYGDEVEVHGSEGEWVPDWTQVLAVMVGDDRVFCFDRDEVEMLPEDGFCHGCGQTSCQAERWD